MFEIFSINKEWNPKQALLKDIILKEERFEEAMQLCLQMHTSIHSCNMLNIETRTFEDEVWDDISEKAFRMKPADIDTTIAWNIWHITRIEDLTANILIADSRQIFNDAWQHKMKSSICDTGNAMSDEEIISFSQAIDMKELQSYRNEVGRNTQSILLKLQPSDMKRKMKKESLNRILEEGGVIDHKDSIWLLDFWGKKNVAGIISMPLTRHQVVHINDCIKLKAKYK